MKILGYLFWIWAFGTAIHMTTDGFKDKPKVVLSVIVSLFMFWSVGGFE